MISRYADDWVRAFRYRYNAERLYRVLPKRLSKFKLELAQEKTCILRFSRFHPSMKRRFTYLGFEFFWKQYRQGVPRVKRRTVRNRLQGPCRKIKEWIKRNRHLPRREFFRRLNTRLSACPNNREQLACQVCDTF
jgi:RNA-directed DNA polymerase